MDIDARMRCSTPVEINGALPLSPPVSPIPHISEFYTSSPESSADNALISSPIPSNRIRVVSLNRLLPSVTSLQDHQVSVSSDNSSHPNHIELVPSTPLPHAPRPRRGGKAICNTCYGAYANEAINGHLPGAVMRVCGVCAAVYREENPGEQAAAAAPQNVSREDEFLAINPCLCILSITLICAISNLSPALIMISKLPFMRQLSTYNVLRYLTCKQLVSWCA